MFAKKTEEKDESLENTMDKMGDIFDTPRVRCLQLKTEFLRKARNYKFWGHNKSRQRVIALDNVAMYCRQSIELAEWGIELRNDVHMDIKSFLLEDHVLPVPRSVREKLGTAGEYAITEAQEVAFMMAELEELRNYALTEFEKEEWSKLEKFNQYSYQLRALRKKIYKEKWVDGYNDHILFDDIQEYECQVKNFLEKFKKILGRREVCIWKKKLKDTLRFSEGILGFTMDYEELEAVEVESHKKNHEETFESIAKSTPERLEMNVAEEPLEMKSFVPEVHDIFEAAKFQESLVENLPDAPVTEFFDNQSSAVDVEIEARLMKLKFFRKAWCTEPSDQTEPEEEILPQVVKTSEPKRKSDVIIDVPILSTKEETEKFNDWYLKKIGFSSAPSSDALGAKYKAALENVSSTDPWTELPAKAGSESPKHIGNIVEELVVTPGVYMDKEVDHNHTKNLSSPCARNLFKGSTCLHSNLNMENMVVLFLAIMKLVNFSNHKLSYVPTVFPTQSQSHPDPSVPDIAYDPILTPVEMRLTRTSRQVVLNHMTTGYLSWLRDTVWEKLYRGKIGAGLKIIQVGEMLLT